MQWRSDFNYSITYLLFTFFLSNFVEKKWQSDGESMDNMGAE
jgi:hypothetical protein